MKKIVLLTCIFLASYVTKAQSPQQKAVQQAITGVFDGMSAADILVIKAHTTPKRIPY